MDSITVYIGLGSNLANPISQVFTAYRAMGDIIRTATVRLSPLYSSKAVGPPGQPDYINAAAELRTTLTPIELLDALQGIETQQQRVRSERWGPRTIDLDILLYDDKAVHTPRLTIPHPYLQQRNFVLVPLLDLARELRLPDGAAIASLLDNSGMVDIVPLPQHSLGTIYE